MNMAKKIEKKNPHTVKRFNNKLLRRFIGSNENCYTHLFNINE
jgi:hypothetical protein